jgi:serine phosphatase RsbU (regulator of sigma subunit)
MPAKKPSLLESIKRYLPEPEQTPSSKEEKKLGLGEIGALLRQDSKRAYSYYQADTDVESTVPQKGLRRRWALAKSLFLSFLRKLSPARRASYLVGLFAFAWGFLDSDWPYAVFGFVVMNFLLALELAEKLLTKDELEIARAIQLSLYPAQNPRLPHIDVASYFQPAHDVGGDYYDFALDGTRRLTVILGDVSGKGIPAALYAMKLQALFELLGKNADGPKAMLVEMNDVISERIERNYFITAVVGIVDFRAERLVLARAGHNHPLHYRSQSRTTEWLRPDGVGLGMKKGASFGGLLEEIQIDLVPGDVLLFYTDGISECMDPDGEPFGYERLEAVLKATAERSAEEIKEQLLRSLDAFRKSQPLADDATIVVAKMT